MEYDSREDDIFYYPYGMAVWEQRHNYVSNTILGNNCSKILDFGMADGKFLQRLTRSEYFELLVGIDIDNNVIDRAQRNLQPDEFSHQYRMCRNHDLKVQLYQGSAFDNYQELKDMNFDCCTMIELIEHVYLSELQKIEQNVFGFLNIPFVIVTTPNKDFNRYFPFYEKQPNAFRHYDHKYEFTQDEFIDWCKRISNTYDYTFEIFGIAPHKSGDKQYGYCSQGSIFKRMIKQKNEDINIQNIDLELELKGQYIYPMNKVDIDKELLDLIYFLFNKYLDEQNKQNEYYSEYLKITELFKNQFIRECEIIQNDQNNMLNFLQKQKIIEISNDNLYFKINNENDDTTDDENDQQYSEI